MTPFTLPSPTECPWSKVCQIDTLSGPVVVYVERDQYGDHAYLPGDTAYLTKYDLPPVDPYAPVADLPSVLASAKPVAAHLNPAPLAYASSWSGPSVSLGGGRGGSSGGDTIISGGSSTTIIRHIHRDGDTIVIVHPDPWEPCGCVEQPEPPIPPIAPVPVPASAGLLLAGLVALAWVRGRK